MTRKSITVVLVAVVLSGCVMNDQSKHLVGTQSSNNVYEFSVTHYADNFG